MSETTKEAKGVEIARGVTKGVASTIAGLGATTVAYYAVKAVTPPILHPIEKVVFRIGGTVVEGLAFTAAAKYVSDSMDESNKAMDTLNDKLDDIEERKNEEKKVKEKKTRKERREEKKRIRQEKKEAEEYRTMQTKESS